MKFVAILAALTIPASATNVVFFLVDDLGVMDVGFNNPDTFYDTPNVNALAKESMRFTDAYAACPVCSPTRSSILTGQYPARTRNTDYFGGPNGFMEFPKDYDAAKDYGTGDSRGKRFTNRPLLPAPYHEELDKAHTTLAEAMKAKGYATMHAGKWHLGGEGSLPTDHGFDINMGGGKGGGPYGGKKYFSPYGNPALPDGPKGEHLPDRLATEVSKFITENKDKPFFVYFPFYSVHTPLIGRPDLVEKYKKKAKDLGLEAKFEDEMPRKNRTVQEHAVYAAMVEATDLAIGKVLKSLEDNGVADDTIVIFFSDNGGLSTSEGSPTTNLPYRAGKGWMYEGGIREPMVVHWPNKVKAGVDCDTPIISTDFFPTILELCGIDQLPEQHKDGKSFAKLLSDPDADLGREPLFWHYPHWGNQGGIPSSAIRDGDWKLIDFYWKKGTELYNLAEDPGEKNNLAEKNPEKVKELKAKLEALRKDTDAIPPTPNPDHKKPFNKW